MAASPDVLIVGGGVIGCAVAWDASRRGIRVGVVERGTPGAAATSAAAGMLSPLGETDPASPLGALARASYERYADFAARIQTATGMDVEFRENGKLHVALTEADESHLVALAEAGGRDVELIDATATHALEPALSTRIRSALFIRRDARVDNRRLGHALWQAAEGAGARFHLGRSVVRVVAGAADFRVHLDDGSTLNTTQMVVAAGAWSDAIEGVPDVPVRPVRGQMLAVSAAVLRRTIHSHGCYLVPRDDGRILIGATVEDVGFEQGPTPAGIQRLLAASLELVPALADAPIVESWAGYRPGTPDEMPILGEDPDVPRLFWAAGHFRNGILLAPITAEVLGRALVGEPVPEIAPFSIRRFRQT